MAISIEQFLKEPEVELRQPATPAQLDELESKTSLSLPQSFRSLYEGSNGLTIPKLQLSFYPIDAILQCFDGMHSVLGTDPFGWLPFTDARDSDPYAICCSPPLCWRIAHVRHDDVASLDFGDLESFLAALMKQARIPETTYIGDLSAHYDNPQLRSTEDVAAGQALLDSAYAMQPDTPYRYSSFDFALRLLTDEFVERFVPMLDQTPDLRELAASRLKRIKSPVASQALVTYQRQWSDFKAQALTALRSAGLAGSDVRDDCVRLKPRPIWFRLDIFYEKRNDPEIFNQIVARARKLAEGQHNPP